MKWSDWRRSTGIEDYRDPQKPVTNQPDPQLSISEILSMTGSTLAKDLGSPTVQNSKARAINDGV